MATSLTAWLRHIGLDGDLAKASTKTLRFRLLSAPARLVTHARRRILKIPPSWEWSADLATAWNRLQALHPHLTGRPPVPTTPQQHLAGRGTRRPPEHPRAPDVPTTAFPPHNDPQL